VRDQLLFKIQALSTAAFAVSFVVTVVDPEWIESVLRLDPDHGNGSLEWLLSAALLVVSLAFAGLARRTWRRIKPVS
jgi:hypothetical protein